MKKLSFFLCLVFAFAAQSFAQVDPCAQNTKLSGGTQLSMNGNQGMGNLSGTSYHYEIWVNSNPSGARLTWYGANQGGGAAFRAEWNRNDDYLGRIGYYWGNGSSYTTYKNIYVDFNYTRSGNNTAGDYSYIGIYGWARNPLVEYYIVEDWFGNQWQSDNTPVTTNTTGGTVQGTFTVDGSTYQVVKNTRNNAPSIDGNTTFTQYFSIRQTPRKCGTISVTEHFKKWVSLNMPMGNMYEAKFLAEAGNGTGWLELSYLKLSQEDQPRGGTGFPGNSSSSTGTTTPSSSSSAPAQATTCKTPLITYPTSTVPADPYTACFKYTNDKCYVCMVSSEGEFQGNVNTCRSAWVWDGTQIESNLIDGFWYQEVTCPAGSSSSAITPSSSSVRASSSSNNATPILENRIPVTYFSVKMQSNKALRIEVNSAATVEIFNLKGNKAASIDVLSGAQTVNLDLPSGMYYAKVRGASVQYAKFVLK